MVLLIFDGIIFDFVEKTDFDVKLNKFSKKSSEIIYHVEAEKKLTNLSKKLHENQKGI